MEERRVKQLDGLGMVWNHFDVAWKEGLAFRAWAGVHGHALAPRDAVHDGVTVGKWLANARRAARRAIQTEARTAEGLPPRTNG